jgi:hypothetical protein
VHGKGLAVIDVLEHLVEDPPQCGQSLQVNARSRSSGCRWLQHPSHFHDLEEDGVLQ